MSKDSKSSYNNIFIPEASGPRSAASGYVTSKPPQRSAEDSPLLTANAKHSWDDTQKALKQSNKNAPSPTSTHTGNSGDYQKDYLMRKRQKEAEEQTQKAQLQTSRLEQQKKDESIKTEQRNQARELRTDIQNWENMRGKGTHDDSAIDGQISMLQARLNSLPPDTQY